MASQKISQQPMQVPQITLQGNRCVTVEGDQQLQFYQPDELILGFKQVALCIKGEELCITTFAKDRLVIQGLIISLSYQALEGQHD